MRWAVGTISDPEKNIPQQQLFAEGRLDAWFDGSAICVDAVGTHSDPIDLGEE